MFVEGGTKQKVRGNSAGELESAPTEWIEREIGELAAHIAAATCRWLELVTEYDRRAAHEAWGFHSCGAWIAWRCGLDPRSAREHVRVARALEDLPLVRERFARGRAEAAEVGAHAAPLGGLQHLGPLAALALGLAVDALDPAQSATR